MKKKDKIRASFSVTPQIEKVTAIARDKILMKVEKALHFWVDDMNRKRAPLLLHFIITLFNVGNVLLCVIYQLNFTVFMYVNTNITLYHVIYSFRYYLRFHVTAVGLGTYYPWIRRSACTY